ncbi:MAG TPA: hypothetical protein VF816_06830 [Rhodocyclaceae bacterium]
MPFPIPDAWNRDTADAERDETKRKESPCSFFFSQGRALVLAANYFSDDRLGEQARGGVALKHRHRIHLALFGQLLAAFEYMLKDFIAKVVDTTAVFDEKIYKAKWIEVNAGNVLASRAVAATPGSILIHPTLGWHYPESVNARYQELFSHQPIGANEIASLNRLWILRHSVAHNAGFVIHHDASRIGNSALAEKVANINSSFISESFDFLCPIAERIATVIGDKVLLQWLASVKPLAADFARDEEIYLRMKRLASYVASRTRDLPTYVVADYNADMARA